MVGPDSKAEKIIKWKFPNDKEPCTVFHIKLGGAENYYRQIYRLSKLEEFTYEDWLADMFGNGLVKIENWETKENTLDDPGSIIKACRSLSREQASLLVLAVQGGDKVLNMGTMGKN